MSRLIFAPLLLAAASCLLPSCVRWNIGRNIREGTETCLGVDVSACYHARPGEVEGIRWPRGGPKSFHDLCPEVLYEADYPLVSVSYPSYHSARRVVRTGYYRPVTRNIVILDLGNAARIGERVQVDAAMLERQADSQEKQPVRPVSPQQKTYSAWHIPAAIAAAPFDYLIDPALSVATTPLFLLGALAARPFRREAEPVRPPQNSTPAP